MNKKFLICFLCIVFPFFLYAQEEEGVENAAMEDSVTENTALPDYVELPDDKPESIWDIDSIFENASEEIPELIDNATIKLFDKITLEASYNFMAGFSPGWDEAPWYKGAKKQDHIFGLKMDSLLTMDLPITDTFRVHTSFHFSLPGDPVFSVKEFYFEYNIKNIAFVKGGLYEIAWGISRFYPFTNLPALVPPEKFVPDDPDDPDGPGKIEKYGDSYIVKLSVPVGVGGFDFLVMTRGGFMGDPLTPRFSEFAYGMKYNLALPVIDIDTGVLFYPEIPLRFFVSLKTTLWDTEFYSEGLLAVSLKSGYKTSFSGNIGFYRDFFKNILALTGELFYNGEPNASWWQSKTELFDEKQFDLYQGFNAALAFIVRPGVLGMRIFTQALYTYRKQSVWLVPGISIKPGAFTFSLSVPMALGKRTAIGDASNYYRNNTDQNNRPFSIVLGISYGGKIKLSF